MNIAVRKIELIEWLAKLEDESLIGKIEGLRKGSIASAYDSNTPATMQDLEEKIRRSELDIAQGKVYSQDQVEAIFKTRFGK